MIKQFTFTDLLHILRINDIIDPKADWIRFDFENELTTITDTSIFMELLCVCNVYKNETNRVKTIDYKDICKAVDNNT